MTKVIGVRFRTAGKIYFFSPGKFEVKRGDQVIVETARGVEFGNVVMGPKEVKDEEITEHKDEIFKSAAKTAEERTRLHYITEAIADQEKITVSRNEVDAYVRQMAQSANMTVEQVTKRLSEQDGLDGVQAKLRQRKTIDFLLKEAKIEA